jgi:DNA (cytosine-5)-methyltransferase 1
MARIIHEVRPRYVFVENSPMLTSRGLGRVLGDPASMGFDARWGVLGAADVGAPHQRDRIWIVAKWRGQLPHAQHDRIRWWEQQQEGVEKKNGKISNTTIKRCEKFSSSSQNKKPTSYVGWHDSHRKSTTDWWTFEPDICRVADGVAFRNDRLKAIGNGQVPLCAATAWRILK